MFSLNEHKWHFFPRTHSFIHPQIVIWIWIWIYHPKKPLINFEIGVVSFSFCQAHRMTFAPAWLHVLILFCAYIHIHKTLLKEFKSNSPYLLWIFMWYRIICLSHLKFIIMLLIWCPMSIRFSVHFCFCCAQVIYTILLDTFSFIQCTGKKTNTIHIIITYKSRRKRHSYHHVAEVFSLFFLCVSHAISMTNWRHSLCS